MHIYQRFITHTCALLADTPADTNHDFVITANIAADAQTILFPADQHWPCAQPSSALPRASTIGCPLSV